MIELFDWMTTVHFPDKPWLILGKGPSFGQFPMTPATRYNLLSLNHVVRQVQVDVAHMIDIDVVEACSEQLLNNCRWLIMPRRPHVGFEAGPPLEDHFSQVPVLAELNRQGRLVWYNLSTGRPVGSSPVISVRYFSSEAALRILGRMGATTVRTLGIDGGKAYSTSFQDLEDKTMLANGRRSFDVQFDEIEAIVKEHKMDYSSLAEPMRVFVGCDDSQMVAAKTLEYSIKKFASRPVDFQIMSDMRVPMPKDPANRPRTGFSFYRFLIPKLCGYRGRALYLDADMQVFTDLAELWDIDFGPHKVLCTNQPGAPKAWKKWGSFFHPGRQMSVMLLDCSRLDWNIEKIIAGLDDGRYDYAKLLFEMCIVAPHEIADLIPPEWNCLEWYAAEQTKLLHYTVVPTQPWKTDDNPLADIWTACFSEAIQAGAISPELVETGIDAGYLKPQLSSWLSLAPSRSGLEPGAELSLLAKEFHGAEPNVLLQQVAQARKQAALARQQILVLQDQAQKLRSEVYALKDSWPMKVSRAIIKPVDRLRDRLRRKAA